MFIRFFKNNNPSLYFILPFFALALWIGAFINTPAVAASHNTMLFTACADLLNRIPYLSTTIAFLLLIGQSFLINHLVNENELITRKSFLPALFYIVYMSNNSAMLTFHPTLVANLFILFAINKILNSYRKNYAFADAFDAGMFLSIATLFYFPSCMLLPLLGIGLIIFRSYNWREWLISFFGVLIPFSFFLTYCFWNDALLSQWIDVKSYFFIHDRPSFDYSSSFYFMLIIGVILLLISLGKIANSILLGSQKTKKNILFICWVLVFSIVSLSIAPDLTSPFLSVLAIPIAIFSANSFINMKKEMIGEFLFLLFIVAILINDFAKYF